MKRKYISIIIVGMLLCGVLAAQEATVPAVETAEQTKPAAGVGEQTKPAVETAEQIKPAAGVGEQTKPVLNEAYLAYIAKYKPIAEEQERLHKIPACITLAQGLLESGAGNSELARNAKNHFGIKCHNEWTGMTYSHDDETRNECFRKYHKAAESYEDHSLFLLRPRYASLFELPITDYKGWAHGLKRCGYATDPTYAAKLIRIIEDYGLAEASPALQEKDSTSPALQATSPNLGEELKERTKEVVNEQSKVVNEQNKEVKEQTKEVVKPEEPKLETAKQEIAKQETTKAKQETTNQETTKAKQETAKQETTKAKNVVAQAMGRRVAGDNHSSVAAGNMGEVSLFSEHVIFSEKMVRWVVAEKGDTYESIGYEFNMSADRLRKYNQAAEREQPEAGQKVYLTRKAK